MTALQAATTGFGLARLGFGLLATAAPSRLGSNWIGEETASKPEVRVLLHALGIRDIALGAGTTAAGRSGTAREWLIACTAADLGDMASTLIGRRHLPDDGVRNTVALTAAAASTGALLVAAELTRS